MRIGHLAALLVAAISCRGAVGPSVPARPTVGPERLRIANAEARRGEGVATLAILAKDADPQVRARAIRGLGRVGDPHAIRVLRELVRHGDAADASQAAAAIGIAGALGSIDDADAGAITGELLARTDVDPRALLEALGRAGDPSALPALTAAVAGPNGDVAAIALGRFGRRGLALDDPARAALVSASASANAALRYAAVYALAREASPPKGDAITAALRARLTDDDAEVRAIAAQALAKRKLAASAEPSLVDRLGDPDWRVGVEAARALGADGVSDPGRAAAALILVRQWARLAAGEAPAPTAHVVLEGLRAIAVPHGPAHEAVRSIAEAPVAGGRDALALGWAQCLAAAATEPGGLSTCGGKALPSFERDALRASSIAAETDGAPLERWTRFAALLKSDDVRVKVAAITAAPKIWAQLDPEARDHAVAKVVEGIMNADDAVIEAACDAVAPYIADPKSVGPAHDLAAQDLRSRAEHHALNPEVTITVLGDLATAKLTAAADACEQARTDPNPAIADAARACVTKLSGTDPGRAAPRAEPARPPVEPAALLGHTVTWTVLTTRGTIVIALDPDLAPWHVAAIVALTRARFYDGLVWHRVVPDFVVQGGDPTGTGAGGPGYTLPAEPGSLLDDPGFTTGAVGIADAGKDTGGSQWFVMHARAPHLDGRYTRVGAVTAGQDVVDALQVDDRILRATVDVR